jgi:hypothetical protein
MPNNMSSHGYPAPGGFFATCDSGRGLAQTLVRNDNFAHDHVTAVGQLDVAYHNHADQQQHQQQHHQLAAQLRHDMQSSPFTIMAPSQPRRALDDATLCEVLLSSVSTSRLYEECVARGMLFGSEPRVSSLQFAGLSSAAIPPLQQPVYTYHAPTTLMMPIQTPSTPNWLYGYPDHLPQQQQQHGNLISHHQQQQRSTPAFQTFDPTPHNTASTTSFTNASAVAWLYPPADPMIEVSQNAHGWPQQQPLIKLNSSMELQPAMTTHNMSTPSHLTSNTTNKSSMEFAALQFNQQQYRPPLPPPPTTSME